MENNIRFKQANNRPISQKGWKADSILVFKRKRKRISIAGSQLTTCRTTRRCPFDPVKFTTSLLRDDLTFVSPPYDPARSAKPYLFTSPKVFAKSFIYSELRTSGLSLSRLNDSNICRNWPKNRSRILRKGTSDCFCREPCWTGNLSPHDWNGGNAFLGFPGFHMRGVWIIALMARDPQKYPWCPTQPPVNWLCLWDCLPIC